jgi:hypothetical protein
MALTADAIMLSAIRANTYRRMFYDTHPRCNNHRGMLGLDCDTNSSTLWQARNAHSCY